MKEDNPIGKSFHVDPALVSFIQQAEAIDKDSGIPEEEKGIHIMLTIGGSIVAGRLIGRDAWADHYRNPEDPATAQPSPMVDNERRYIHLKDVKVYQGGRVIPAEGEGFLWRGKVASVDGFMLGGLETISVKQEPRTIDINGVRISVE